MADDVDKAQEMIDAALHNKIEETRVELLPGKPGDCEVCGEWSGRLVNGICAPCRDKYGLP